MMFKYNFQGDNRLGERLLYSTRLHGNCGHRRLHPCGSLKGCCIQYSHLLRSKYPLTRGINRPDFCGDSQMLQGLNVQQRACIVTANGGTF